MLLSLESLARLYEKWLLAGMALIPGVTIWYLLNFLSIPMPRFESHEWHELVIAISIVSGLFISYVSWRSYQASGEIFLRWVTAAFLVFSLVYAPHGFLTRFADHNIWLFLLFGPASRFAMLCCLTIGLLQYGKPPENLSKTNQNRFFWHVLTCSAVIVGVVAAVAFSSFAGSLWVRLTMEVGALTLCLTSLGIMLWRRIDSPLMVFFAIALMVFAQADLAFMLGKPWDHLWWLAHVIFAAGFFILSWGVVRALLTTRSFSMAYSQEKLMRALEHGKVESETLNKHLQASQIQLLAIFNGIQDCVITTDKQGKIQTINQSAEKTFGYTAEEVLGSSFEIIIPEGQGYEAYLRENLATGDHNNIGVVRERIGRRKNGENFPIEIWVNETKIDGEPLFTASMRDITERKLIDGMLSVLTGELSYLTGKAFIEAACRHLTHGLGTDYAFVGTLNQTGCGVDVIGGWTPCGVMKPFSYILADTPCANVVKRGLAVHTSQVNLLFPKDILLEEMQIESYVGLSLFDKKKQPIGVLVALSTRPLRREALAARLLSLFVEQISAEIVRMEDEARLNQSASVFEHANEGIMITDPEGTIIDVNAAFSRITGFSHEEILGQNPRIFSSGHHDRNYHRSMWESLIEKGYWSGEVWNRRKNGELFAAMETISSVEDESGTTQRYVSLFSEITALKEYQHQLERTAHFDSLTDLPNRSLLTEQLQQAMAQAQRRQNLLAVVFLDLDGFKAVNDTHGHDKGDKLLQVIAQRMQAALREGDTLARIGGDEFVGVLVDLADENAALPVINRLLEAAAQTIHVGDLKLNVTASAGASFFPQLGRVAADQLMRQADLAMYGAKQTGKNRFQIFDTSRDQAERSHNEDIDLIRQALADNELVLYYQPKVDMRSGRVVGVEALIRWQHPERGLLLPGAFLPSISHDPLAIEVGEWVMEAAAAQVEAWRAQELNFPVSVNIDSYHLAQPDFIDKLKACLARHPTLQSGDLELEVLESSAIEDVSKVGDIISACEAIGINFALDDFGTGYSTLTYLKRLPAQLLKIDQSFVRGMLDDPDDLAIIDGVLGLAEAFRREAIAEGVESIDHGVMLLSLGCRLAQGFSIARPMPPEEVPRWARSWRPNKAWAGRPRVGSDNLSVLFSMVEHRAWVLKLHGYLRGQANVPPPLQSNSCRFGEWLRQTGTKEHGSHPLIEQIEVLHEKVHRQGDRLVALKLSGESAAALDGFTDVEETREDLLALMWALAASLTQKGCVDQPQVS